MVAQPVIRGVNNSFKMALFGHGSRYDLILAIGHTANNLVPDERRFEFISTV